jgi:flavin reductase (DIM6/NTAB) family NADH-FMN oxidoreductase RutF
LASKEISITLYLTAKVAECINKVKDISMSDLGEDLRRTMRHWVTGVSIVTSQHEGVRHGMTVNSLASVSLDPPTVLVTIQHDTRTYRLVSDSGIVGITVLSAAQAQLSDQFAGKIPEHADRFEGVETFTWLTGAPLIAGGLAYLDCRVNSIHPLEHSTLFILDVIGARPAEQDKPLVYFNRLYQELRQ